jgi:hypothetical protein
MASSGS